MMRTARFMPALRIRHHGSVAATALAGLALLGAGHALAQAPARPAVTAAPAPVFAIKGFQVTGDNPLGEGETARVLEPFVLPRATLETLQQATAALEAALREKGFGLHRVALPPQDVGATVRLAVVRFTVNKVAIEGRSLYDEGNVRRTLPELREGDTPNFKRLAVQTAIANENANKQVQLGIRESELPDRIDATITVREKRPWNFAVGVSNAGSDATGNDRFTVSGGHTNLFDHDHQFIGAYTTSLKRDTEVKQVGLAYKIPFYPLGGVFGMSYTVSDVVGNFGAFSSTGAGRTWGMNYTFYLPPNSGRRSYVTLATDNKLFQAGLINGVAIPGQLDRRSWPVSIGYTARTESDVSAWGYNTELAANTGLGLNNSLVAYQSEDPRITQLRWAALRGGTHYLAPVGAGWLLGARTQFQYSESILISGEQFGLGGLGSVRGTEIERPLSADSGISGTLELSTPEIVGGLRVLGFVDGGWLANNDPNTALKPASDRVMSAGVGVRFNKGPVSLSADYGRIARGSRVDLAANPAAPQTGDERVYLSLSLRF